MCRKVIGLGVAVVLVGMVGSVSAERYIWTNLAPDTNSFCDPCNWRLDGTGYPGTPGEPNAGELFIRALRSLHSRRSIAGSTLPRSDMLPDEHRMSEDLYLADLWKAYKKCIRTHRTGPASQLLRDIEEQVIEAK